MESAAANCRANDRVAGMAKRTNVRVYNTAPWAGAATLEFVARIPGRHFLRNLVERRALVAQLVRRDFRTRYVGSSAGWLWGVIHPIVQLLIWIMVFKYWIK